MRHHDDRYCNVGEGKKSTETVVDLGRQQVERKTRIHECSSINLKEEARAHVLEYIRRLSEGNRTWTKGTCKAKEKILACV